MLSLATALPPFHLVYYEEMFPGTERFVVISLLPGRILSLTMKFIPSIFIAYVPYTRGRESLFLNLLRLLTQYLMVSLFPIMITPSALSSVGVP